MHWAHTLDAVYTYTCKLFILFVGTLSGTETHALRDAEETLPESQF